MNAVAWLAEAATGKRNQSIELETSPQIRWLPTKQPLKISSLRSAQCVNVVKNCLRFTTRIHARRILGLPRQTSVLPTIRQRFTLLLDSEIQSLASAHFG
jgi:hypothetical protein